MLLLLAGICTQTVYAQVYDLSCEHLTKPIGIDAPAPRLSWKMQSKAASKAQSAYELWVGTDSLLLHKGKQLVWNSGKVNAGSNLVTYAGTALQPFTKYFWTVKVWDDKAKQLKPGPIASFETGFLPGTSWSGSWISDHNYIHRKPAGYFRKTFKPTKKIRSAHAYIAVAGLYELSINGKKVGTHRLDPMFTRFDRRNVYVSYDVTAQIQGGQQNAIGVVLGNGWYNHQALAVWDFDKAPWRARPTFCLNLRIAYADGTIETIVTDESWLTNDGAIVSNNIYTGEHYDSRKSREGWDRPQFEDKDWLPVILRSAPSKLLVSQQVQPIRDVEHIAASNMNKINDSTYVFDLGRNIAGVSQIKLQGTAGTVVKLIHGERLHANGQVDLSNIDVYYRPKDTTDPFQTDIVYLDGKQTVNFMPKFNYKGFQYVEVRANKVIVLKKEDLSGHFMHSDVEALGEIKTSHDLVSKLWKATNSAYLSNLYGYPTDCPQREKNGWTGDGHFAIETGLYNFDGITVYEKWMADHRDEQQPNGVLPDIIPTGGWGYGTANGTDWTSTIAIIPWNLYLFYGDIKPLASNYENMKRYVNYVQEISPNALTSFGRGDWVPVKSTSNLEYTSSVYYYVDATIVAKAAKLLGHAADYKKYSALAQEIKAAINGKYFNANTGIYASGVQTELSMALLWDIVPTAKRQQVADNLAERVVQDNMHLDVGVLGAKAILNALSENGHPEIAYRLAVQDSYPSWGWWIKNGATTLHENWDMDAPRDISENHMMFGEIGAWFFKGLGGIFPDEQQPGFKHIVLRPYFPADLSDFDCSFESPYGRIQSAWVRTGNKITYTVRIPANSHATLRIPLKNKEQVYVQGKPVAAEQKLAAGDYTFIIE